MTTPPQDITQNEYSQDAKAMRAILIGKTSGGAYVEIQVDSDGKVQVA